MEMTGWTGLMPNLLSNGGLCGHGFELWLQCSLCVTRLGEERTYLHDGGWLSVSIEEWNGNGMELVWFVNCVSVFSCAYARA